MAMVNLPRLRSSARSSHAHCRWSTVRNMPVSIASSAKSSVCISKKGARWSPTLTAYSRRRRSACAISLSIRRGVGAGQSQIGFDAGLDCAARRLRFEKVRVEAFERIEPVVIAGDRIDRLGEPLERQIKLGFIIFDRAGRIDDVRRYDEKLHIVAVSELQIARDQRVLRSVTFAGIADDEKAEIPIPGHALRIDPKELIAAAIGPATASIMLTRHGSTRSSVIF